MLVPPDRATLWWGLEQASCNQTEFERSNRCLHWEGCLAEGAVFTMRLVVDEEHLAFNRYPVGYRATRATSLGEQTRRGHYLYLPSSGMIE